MNNNTKRAAEFEIVRNNLKDRVSQLGYMPRWFILLLDMALCSLAFILSFVVAKGFHLTVDESYILDAWQQGIIVLLTQLVFFLSLHTYMGIIRYSTFKDMLRCMASTFSAAVLLIGFNLILQFKAHLLFFSTTNLVIYAFIAFVFLFVLRVSVKMIFEYIQNAQSPKVMIYGVQEAGIAIAKMLRSANNSPYHPVGFICDKNEEARHDILGLPVKVLNQDLFTFMRKHDVHEVIISPMKMKSINPGTNLSIFLNQGIRVLSTPAFTNWEDVDKTSEQDLASRIGNINDIKVEDLLERPTIEVNTENVAHIIANRVVMVTGAAGSIGSELVRQVAKYTPKAIVLVEQAESPLHDLVLDLNVLYPKMQFIPFIADVRQRDRLEFVFQRCHPEVIFHAAAYKHVPLMELHPNEAILANVSGTKNMADLAVKYEVDRFVMISTDKAVNPTNVMGCSKRIAEIYVQSLFKKLIKENLHTTKFITTRFGNVLGSNGSVIPYFKKQIAAGGPVTVTHPDIIRYFMTIPEACTLVMEAATLGNGGEIFVFDMGHPVKIYDLAKNMIQLAGLVPGKDIEITFTGLRPGEKLYEELLNNKEQTIPTPNPKIMVAKVREFDFDTVTTQIDELITIAHQDKTFSTVRKMKDIVPEFVSKNSVFEQLD